MNTDAERVVFQNASKIKILIIVKIEHLDELYSPDALH